MIGYCSGLGMIGITSVQIIFQYTIGFYLLIRLDRDTPHMHINRD